MMNKLKLVTLGVLTAAVLTPVTASAFTFFPRSLDPGDTFMTSQDPNDGVNDGILGGDFGATSGVPASFSYDFTIANDQAFSQTVRFDLLQIAGLENFTFDLAGFFTGATGATDVTLAANESATLTIMFDNLTGNNRGRFEASIAAVPLPAGLLLLLTAVGGLAIARRRKMGAATA